MDRMQQLHHLGMGMGIGLGMGMGHAHGGMHGMHGMGMHNPMMGMHHGHGMMGMGAGYGHHADDGGTPLKVKSFMRGKKKRKKKKKRTKEEAAVRELIAQGRRDRLKAKMAAMNSKKRRLAMAQMETQKCAVDSDARICVDYDERDGSVRIEYSTVHTVRE